METTIDEVIIEIESNADKSSAGLNSLISTLDTLQSKISPNITKLSKLNDTLIALTTNTNNINIDTSGIKNITDTFSSLQNIGEVKNLKSLLTQLEKIPEITSKLDTKTISDFSNRINELVIALEPLSEKLLVVGNAMQYLPTNIDKVSNSINKFNSKAGNTKNVDSLTNKISKLVNVTALVAGLKTITNYLGKAINESNSYIENLNLFNVSIGEAATKAKEFTDNFSEALGVDPSNTMRYMGIFNTLAKGFGLTSEMSYTMSKNLTQLSYDMSSFLNIPIDQAMKKIKSGFSGEIEPMRAVGVALDQATLQETAYTLGIKKNVSEMTRAQKTQLLYYQMMTKTTTMQGDMARTILQPANAIRVLKQQFTLLARAVGNIFIPILTAAIPYIQVLTKWLTAAAQAIANLFGFKIDTSAWESSLENISGGVEDIGDNAKDTTKELKKMLAPFDELNVIDFGNDKSGSSAGVGADGLLDIPLPEYDALKGLQNTNLDKVAIQLKQNLPAIATAVDLFFTLLGKTKIGGVIKIFEALTEIITSIKDIAENGPNFDNVTSVIRGLSGIAIAIGLLTGHFEVVGVGMFFEGLITSIKEIQRNWEAIKQGDWSGIDKGTMVISVIEMLGGIVMALYAFSKIKGVKDITKSADTIKEVTKATNTVDTNIGKLSPKLKSLAKNLAMGIAIIAEVAVSAALVAGAIWILGKELEQIGIAWQPVIDNGTTIAIAMGIGTGILLTIGIITDLLGKSGKTLIVNMAIGTAILLELGIATGLFITEIWAIGEGLNKINEAWQPVLNNGQTIITAIGIGTGILIAIGTVTALLGIATTATGGLLPLAIGLGTVMLLELGIATGLFITEIWAIGEGLNKINEAWQPVLNNGENIERAIAEGTKLLIAIGVVSAALGAASVASVGLLPLAINLGTKMLDKITDATIKFIDSLAKVAEQLIKKLSPALKNLNKDMPELNTNLKNYIEFMKIFAGYSVAFTKESAVAGFANTINTIIGWFVKDPIEQFADDVNKNYKQIQELNEKLRLANPELQTAINLMQQYFNFLQALDNLTGKNSNISLAGNMFVDMKEVGKKFVTGFVEGIKSEYSSLSNAIKSVLGDALSSKTAQSYGKDFGKQIASGISTGLKNATFPKLKGILNTTSTGATITFKAYAEGGFPDTGEAFIARENGPELIGRIGNKSTVANNDQIIEGIRQGVAAGVSEAMPNQQQKNPTNIYIGNRKVYSGYGQYANQENNMYGTNVIRV